MSTICTSINTSTCFRLLHYVCVFDVGVLSLVLNFNLKGTAIVSGWPILYIFHYLVGNDFYHIFTSPQKHFTSNNCTE